MQSEFLKLNGRDFAKGVVSAVTAGVIFTLGGIVSQNGFDVFSTDWSEVLRIAVNAGFAAFVGYLGKNLLTDKEGKVLGKI